MDRAWLSIGYAPCYIHLFAFAANNSHLNPLSFPFLKGTFFNYVDNARWVGGTDKWIWGRSIYSLFKPSFNIKLFQYFWRFSQICKKFAVFARKIVFVIVSEQFYYRNNNKNLFASKCYKYLTNLCKPSEIVEQRHVKWWLKYRNNRSVSWKLSCKNFMKASEQSDQN